LRVDGLGAQPLALSLSEVEALAAQTHTADCLCEEGWMVPEQQWDGIAVTAILGRAGVQPEARFLKVYAGDYTVLMPLEEALAGGALLARRLNGAPLRLVAPGRAGLYSVKWVDRLAVLAEEAPPPGKRSPATDGRVERAASRPALRGVGASLAGGTRCKTGKEDGLSCWISVASRRGVWEQLWTVCQLAHIGFQGRNGSSLA
jgi:DMSO/TMAO reductase YedYZ molybdopterin-dependent catalytic subunit